MEDNVFRRLTSGEAAVANLIIEAKEVSPRDIEQMLGPVIGYANARTGVEALVDYGLVKINDNLKLEMVLNEKVIQEALDKGAKEVEEFEKNRPMSITEGRFRK